MPLKTNRNRAEMRIRLAPQIRTWAEAEARQYGVSINSVVSSALERVIKLSKRANASRAEKAHAK